MRYNKTFFSKLDNISPIKQLQTNANIMTIIKKKTTKVLKEIQGMNENEF